MAFAEVAKWILDIKSVEFKPYESISSASCTREEVHVKYDFIRLNIEYDMLYL